MATKPSQPSLDAEVRQTVDEWMRSHNMSQNRLAALIGRPQPWVSRYLSTPDDEFLETLARIVDVFGYSLPGLLASLAREKQSSAPDEVELLTLFRQMPAHARPAVLQLLRAWLKGPPGGAGRTRK